MVYPEYLLYKIAVVMIPLFGLRVCLQGWRNVTNFLIHLTIPNSKTLPSSHSTLPNYTKTDAREREKKVTIPTVPSNLVVFVYSVEGMSRFGQQSPTCEP